MRIYGRWASAKRRAGSIVLRFLMSFLCVSQGHQKQCRLPCLDPLLPGDVLFLAALPGLVWQLTGTPSWTAACWEAIRLSHMVNKWRQQQTGGFRLSVLNLKDKRLFSRFLWPPLLTDLCICFTQVEGSLCGWSHTWIFSARSTFGWHGGLGKQTHDKRQTSLAEMMHVLLRLLFNNLDALEGFLRD